MFSRFFIDRPIFASVLSIVITLAGAIAVFSLPLAQYPPITPPTIQVMCNYPGASAQVVAESVGAPIEQQVNGVENMLYMSSQSTNDGAYSLSVTFKPGVNLNFAQVLVQNRVNLALPLLPDVVRATGVTTRKRSPDILVIVSLYGKDKRFDQLYLSNYATLQIKDEIARVDGVGDVFLFGAQDYSMRVWLDPDKLASRNLTAGDVVAALREQSVQVATGQIGQPPVGAGQSFQLVLNTLGRLSEAEDFEEITIRATPDGRRVRIKDVGRAVLAAKNLDITNKLDGVPCTSLAIFQLPDANALDTADRVRAKMDELKASFPEGMFYESAYDTTPFIRESVNEVFKALRDAIILVAVVVLVFLQNWRSTIIPLVAVPVAIIGTFAVMAAIGFSINNLTLFGLVLAIGIVVDDAIVVVEAVEHHIEEGMAPRAATLQAMSEVSGPVIAVALVLSAVFIPCAFISGINGQFFRQFALTIAASTLISMFNSLTLSPALTAILLKPRDKKSQEVLPRLGYLIVGGWLAFTFLTPVFEARFDLGLNVARILAGVGGGVICWALGPLLNRLLSLFFRGFNSTFRVATAGYIRVVRWSIRLAVLVLLVYGALLGATYWGFRSQPVGYIPLQDKGYLLASIQLPDAASIERTRETVDAFEQICLHTDGVAHTIAVVGQSFTLGANGSNFGNMFIPLKDFSERSSPDLYSDVIADKLRKRAQAELPDAIVSIFGPPAVQGLGTAGGFKFIVEDRENLGLVNLQKQIETLISKSNERVAVNQAAPPANSADPSKKKDGKDSKESDKVRKYPALSNLFTVFRANSPQLFVDVNRDQCATLNVAIGSVFQTLQVYLGSLYVNDFNLFGRTWQVVAQAEGDFRNEIEDVRNLRVRSNTGNMVPMGTVASIREINGPLIVIRYNDHVAAAINGNTSAGFSSGDAINQMEALADKELQTGMVYEWTELSKLQIDSSHESGNVLVIPLAVLAVFLVLAALYESWSLPLAVILVVPMCILGSIIGVAIAKSDINIFTQIGFVVLIGLASKNAILIVEFAKDKREEGLSRLEATLQACKLRLRPILMTSFAFILGVLPLLLAVGAGAEMRRTLGNAVFSGMLGVTIFGIFLTPVFFYLIDKAGEARFLHSRTARFLNIVLFDVLTLGIHRVTMTVFHHVQNGNRKLTPQVSTPSATSTAIMADASPNGTQDVRDHVPTPPAF